MTGSPLCYAELFEQKGTRFAEAGLEDVDLPPLLDDARIATMRFILHWRGHRIRSGWAIGVLDADGPKLSPVGLLCVKQWLEEIGPESKIVFVEFRDVRDRKRKRMRKMIERRLNAMTRFGEDGVLIFVAENSKVYDEIGSFFRMQRHAPH
ncbi:hypothetical protein BH20PSE1_BH20PSE1_01320 [soil metagenome]